MKNTQFSANKPPYLRNGATVQDKTTKVTIND